MAPQIDPDIERLLRKNKKLEAIKRLQTRTNLGLAEAQALIEAFQQTRGQVKDLIQKTRAPGTLQAPARPAAVPHAQQHQFDRVEEQTPAQIHEIQRRAGLGPGEVPAPKYQVVRAALFLLLFAAGIWYLLN
jgi:hypothetical protein